MSATPEITAIVVNFDAGELLTRCVRSLEVAGAEEIVVVDNGSTDDSIERLESAGTSATLVKAEVNKGYGAGVNLGAKYATHEVLLICNSDLVVDAAALTPLRADLAELEDVAAVGPRTLTAGGEVYPSARAFPSLAESAGHAFVGLFSEQNRWTRSYKRLDRDLGPEAEEEPREVDWVSGSCAAIRAEAFRAVGGFDEGYFMYVEDVDLCWRLRRAGWRIIYDPRGSVTHVQGVSTARRPYRMIAAHHRSMWRFARKTATGKGRLALPAVGAGLALRFGMASAKHALAGAGKTGGGRGFGGERAD